jgi:hypothetical protein
LLSEGAVFPPEFGTLADVGPHKTAA